MAVNYKIEISGRAKKDLDEILHYLLTNHSRETASKTYKVIIEKIESLSKMPTAHPIYQNKSDKLTNFVRWVMAKKLNNIYSIIEEDVKGVLVARIKHVKTGPAKVLTALEEE